ncbi:uncharacterized protein LOC129592605 isoform X2 [Paramacrobiotus metropolitanus]|uniref:uncharacterized protein LOC129592605 isoform X2 n=1 Tax=Paramacrobiotus metropolitanus TaxID=2943436 RepID=UPI002445ACC6|nr:uncharacterized protein LOC129592605 isoform X2 [Paramacrobiotus metropolitanus]
MYLRFRFVRSMAQARVVFTTPVRGCTEIPGAASASATKWTKVTEISRSKSDDTEKGNAENFASTAADKRNSSTENGGHGSSPNCGNQNCAPINGVHDNLSLPFLHNGRVLNPVRDNNNNVIGYMFENQISAGTDNAKEKPESRDATKNTAGQGGQPITKDDLRAVYRFIMENIHYVWVAAAFGITCGFKYLILLGLIMLMFIKL